MSDETKRARVLAAVRGEPVAQLPVSLWLHNFAKENSAGELAEETIRLAKRFDFDYLKPQSRAQCFSEMWGLTYRPPVERATPYTVTHHPLHDAQGFRRLAPADPRAGALGEQIEALALIRRALGPKIPIIWTVFSPMMVARFLFPGNEAQVLELVRTDPTAVEEGLEAITETLTEYVRACLEAGADGLYFAVTAAREGQLTAAECRRFQRPFDLRILDAASSAPFNVLHLCGDSVLFDEFTDYPIAAFSWAAGASNPSLSEGHRRTGRAVIGGFPAKPMIAAMPPGEVAAMGRAAVAEMQRRYLLLGPACSINPDTPDAVIDAAVSVAMTETR